MALHKQAFAFTVLPPLAITAILYFMRPPLWDAMRIAGLAMTIFGIGLLTVARAQLGNSFSITTQARALVTSGLYSKIRHPVYVFSAIGIAGLLLYLGMPMLLLLLVIVVPMQVLRARAEEKVLEEKFGDEFRAWKKTTWF